MTRASRATLSAARASAPPHRRPRRLLRTAPGLLVLVFCLAAASALSSARGDGAGLGERERRARTSSATGDDRWPQFRGPGGQGHATATGLPLTWSESEHVAWKTPIPGKGWSSPVIEGGQVWVTTGFETPASEAEKARRLEGTTNNQPLDVAASVSLHAVGVDARTGERIGDVELLRVQNPQPIHALNSYASPTPVIEKGRLYAHFGDYGTACLDTRSLEVLWRNQELHLEHENGPGSSPVLWRDKLIFHCDGSDVQYIVALEKATGKVAWKSDRSGKLRDHPQLKKAYSTPLVVEIAGRPQLVSPAADWVYGYDPATGEELWKLSYGELGFSIVPRPVAGHGMFYLATCFLRSRLLAVRYRDGEKGWIEPRIEWSYKRQVPKMTSPLLVGDEIYFVEDNRGILTALDARTGEPRWVERVGGNFAASPLYADGRIYLSSREGVTTVIAPGRSYRKLAENRLDGRIMASLAVAGSALFVRTDRALYRIEEPGRAVAAGEPRAPAR